MKPSKTAYATKKKPAKRKNNPMVDKLLQLKYRINDAYTDGTMTGNKSDKDFVIGLINNIRNGTNLPIARIQLEECNKLWKRYRSELDYEG